MTPDQYISLVRNRLPKIHHEEVIRHAIGRAYSIFMAEQDDLTPFRKDYVVDVLRYLNGKQYLKLPVIPLNVVHSIHLSTIDEDGYYFDEYQDGEHEVNSGLDVNLISDIIGYKRRTDKILFYGMDSEIKKVNIGIVIPFEKFDPDEDIYMPTGSEELIIETTVNFLEGDKPILDINDGSEVTK